MQVLRAYANTDTTSKQNFNNTSGKLAPRENKREQIQQKPSGDTITLSTEAMEMLENQQGSVSLCPQDATYDQNGNMTRQFDNLQNELRRLATHFFTTPDGSGTGARIHSLQTQLANIQATV